MDVNCNQKDTEMELWVWYVIIHVLILMSYGELVCEKRGYPKNMVLWAIFLSIPIISDCYMVWKIFTSHFN